MNAQQLAHILKHTEYTTTYLSTLTLEQFNIVYNVACLMARNTQPTKLDTMSNEWFEDDTTESTKSEELITKEIDSVLGANERESILSEISNLNKEIKALVNENALPNDERITKRKEMISTLSKQLVAIKQHKTIVRKVLVSRKKMNTIIKRKQIVRTLSTNQNYTVVNMLVSVGVKTIKVKKTQDNKRFIFTDNMNRLIAKLEAKQIIMQVREEKAKKAKAEKEARKGTYDKSKKTTLYAYSKSLPYNEVMFKLSSVKSIVNRLVALEVKFYMGDLISREVLTQQISDFMSGKDGNEIITYGEITISKTQRNSDIQKTENEVELETRNKQTLETYHGVLNVSSSDEKQETPKKSTRKAKNTKTKTSFIIQDDKKKQLAKYATFKGVVSWFSKLQIEISDNAFKRLNHAYGVNDKNTKKKFYVTQIAL